MWKPHISNGLAELVQCFSSLCRNMGLGASVPYAETWVWVVPSMSLLRISAGVSSYTVYFLQHESRVSSRTMHNGRKAFISGKRICLSQPYPQERINLGSVEWAWLVGMELFLTYFLVLASCIKIRLAKAGRMAWNSLCSLIMGSIHSDTLASTFVCWDHRHKQSRLVSPLFPV